MEPLWTALTFSVVSVGGAAMAYLIKSPTIAGLGVVTVVAVAVTLFTVSPR